jgi:hypothetical protein
MPDRSTENFSGSLFGLLVCLEGWSVFPNLLSGGVFRTSLFDQHFFLVLTFRVSGGLQVRLGRTADTAVFIRLHRLYPKGVRLRDFGGQSS